MSKNANSFKAAFFYSMAFELPIETINTKHSCYEEIFPQHTLRCLQKSRNKSILSNTLVLTCMATKLPNTKLPQIVCLSVNNSAYTTKDRHPLFWSSLLVIVALLHCNLLFTQYSKLTLFLSLLFISGETFTALRQLFNRWHLHSIVTDHWSTSLSFPHPWSLLDFFAGHHKKLN